MARRKIQVKQVPMQQIEGQLTFWDIEKVMKKPVEAKKAC